MPAATLRARAVFTNTVPNNVMRSSGRPEVTFAIERLIDTAATELGFDRIELRRKNLIRPDQMPYTNAVGSIYDSGTYEANMELCMRIADWDGFESRRRQAAARGKLLGLGFANYVESSTGSPKERAAITVTAQGRVEVVIGTQPSGQGHETSFAQVVSDLLAVPFDSIDIILGDTDIVKEGGGSHSGRSMRHAATVISMAAGDLIAKGKTIAAAILATTPEEVEFKDGRFGATRANRTFDFLELAKEAAARAPAGARESALAVVKDNEMHAPVFPNGCGVCEVEVDPDTGRVRLTRFAAVDDVGRCINPMTVDGQTHGSIAHGVGEALCEQICLDPGFRAAAHRIVLGIRNSVINDDAVLHHRDRRSAVADESFRHQVGKRGRHRGRAGGRHQRHRRCAQGVRDSRRQDAGDAADRVAGDRKGQGEITLERDGHLAGADDERRGRGHRQGRMRMARVTITVNGKEETRDIKPRTLLVEFLRDHLGLTGTHVGCDTTQCGCCIVLVDGRSVNSCTMLAVQANGANVTTIEGLAKGDKLHPMQAAFREHHALQCGFCTPGMVMSALELVQRNKNPSDDDIRYWLLGNMCRCTGYHNIVKAIKAGAASMARAG